MPTLVIGATHRTLGSEALCELGQQAPEIASLLHSEDSQVVGSVVLATCNRFELYLDSCTFHGGVEQALSAVRAVMSGRPRTVEAMHVHSGEAVARHLFSVACGLDSMVVGEAQIAGQVRAALAGSEDTVTPVLRRLFHQAVTTAKAVATRTGLGSAGRSIASVGLDLVERRHGPLAGRDTLVLGTGDFAGVVVAELSRRSVASIGVHSRSGRGERFATTHPQVHVVSPGMLRGALAEADLLVTCSRPGFPSLAADFVAHSRLDRGCCLPVLDLSGAGELSPEAMRLDLLDAITLDEIGRNAPEEHTSALATARELVDAAVAAYLHMEEGRRAAPAVTAMRAHISEIIARESAAAHRQYSEETAAAVERSLRRVSSALLHTPSVRAAELARQGELKDYVRAMHILFGITVEAS